MVTPNTKLSSVENSGIGSIEKLPGNNRGTTAEATKPAINVHKTH